jgi:calcineurin-like phosphoesterase
MTGPRGGVIGVKREQAVEALTSLMPVRFTTAEEDPWLMAVAVTASQPMRAEAIEQILLPAPGVK